MSAPHGPYETEDDARTLAAVQAIYEASRASNRRGVMGGLCQRMLEEACEQAGVELGAYDRRILAWLAGFEPQACAVIAGLITRAAEHSGEQLAAIRLVLGAFNWEVSDRQYALEQIDDIVRGAE